MSAFLDALGALHVLRPWWLLALPLLALIWWQVRQRARGDTARPRGIAPHLAEALTVGDDGTRRLQPIDGVALSLALLAIAASGPTWSRIPNPLLAQTAPLVVALEVTPSMEAPDLQPYRLERAKFKILDLIDRRAGARTALVAYAGTSHRVAPLTEDPNILRSMLEALSHDVMPEDGQNATDALALARAELAKSETPGAILFVLDSLDEADLPAFVNGQGDGSEAATAPVIFLVAAPEGSPTDALERVEGSEIVWISADDRDLDRIEGVAKAAYRAAILGDERLDWDDRGWVFGWLAMPFLLIWFRRGWTMRWSVVLALGVIGGAPGGAQAGVADWFFTPDQQGMMAFRNKEYIAASEHFMDPMWRGLALFRAGKYAEAADVYSRMDTPEAAFGEGMARTRNREYRPAIRAYEKALDLQPDFPDAEYNLAVTKAILDYVETAREAGDTGEVGGIGADDVVFDNEAERGEETETDFSEAEADGPEFQTAEQWMRSVDTDMSDFMRVRFLQESASGGAE